MKHLKTTLLLVLCSGSLYAQNTINATGGQTSIGGNTYEFSVGEMALVNTLSSATVTVTQGVLQPAPKSATNTNDIISREKLLIYPNPSNAIVNLEPQFSTAGSMNILLLDVSGKTLLQKSFSLLNGNEKQQIDITDFAHGNYILNVNFINGNKILKNSYKIQKLK